MTTALTVIAVWHLIAALPIAYAYALHLRRKLHYRRAMQHSARLDDEIRRHENRR